MDTNNLVPREHRDRGGFTLIEVMIAMIIFTIGVLGLAGMTGFVVQQTSLSDLMTERSTAFQTAIDRLQSLPFDSVSSGVDSVGIFQVDWTSTLDGPQNKVVTLVTLGPGMANTSPPSRSAQVADTFQFRVLRR